MKTHLLLVTSLLLTSGLSAQTIIPLAPEAASAGLASLERRGGPLLRALDRDRDGMLSREELRLAPFALAALDLDEDGFLLGDEISPNALVPHRVAANAGRRIRSRSPSDLGLIVALDANHDGILHPLEIANAASSLQRLDLNGDGVITQEELQTFAPRAESI
jgi:Ca2+-binding EF-hand superfamily protein